MDRGTRGSTGRQRLVVVGGDAAGMSAASQARRLKGPDELEIVAFERGRFTSYSACGIPYWVGGDVTDRERLIARTPEQHRARDIDVRLRSEVTELDLDGGRVRVRDLESGTESWTGYDRLVLATGARPVRPPLPGIDAPGVHGVQTLEDGQALLDTLDATEGRRAVVVGAGYIGVEMAEALLNRGYEVTVLNRGEQPMSTLDPDMGRLVHAAMDGLGITTVGGAEVAEILTGADGRVRAVAAGGEEYPADVVVLGIGVEPETALARAAGLPLGAYGGLLTDLAMRVRGREEVWAGGDCVEVLDLVSGRERHIPLGTHANKHGQVIGANVADGYGTFPGVVGTAVSKVCSLEIARTGLRERDAREVGLRYVTAVTESTSRAGYYPGAAPMTVKMIAERRTGRLLGTQIVGREGAGKRVDIAAVALTAGMTVDQVAALDLGYAPPFSPVWDPVQVAARKAAAAVREAG
ncbi:FAD-dependent oxidoreductase [Streptomyces sp. NPDC003090]|uniref:FAD-dependent oxidoreductase n=1 Tax=Streptomyces sp. NPDC003090 TaxID=3154274 RepID=UPI003829699D